MKYIKSGLKIILLVLVLILAYQLRRDNYHQVPLPGQSMDEYSYSWVGLSLIRLGLPVGISGIDGYKNNEQRYINVDRVYQSGVLMGNPVTVNYPWFDHPPLMGLVTGGFAYLQGARVFEDTSAFIIRKPMVLAGTATVLLVFLVALVNFDYLTALAVASIYASMPIAVIGSRMIQAENGVIPLTLLSILFLSLYLKKQKYTWLFFSAFSAGIATLFKLSGVVNFLIAWPVLFYFFGKDKKRAWLDSLYFGVIASSLTSLFLLYGLIYDRQTFMNVFFSNSNRFYGIGADAFYHLLIQVRLTQTKFLTDAWPLAGWLAWIYLMGKSKKSVGEYLISASVTAYLITYLLMGSHPYGWYAFPFWPLLTLCLGKTLTDGFQSNKNALIKFLVLLLPLGLILGKLTDINSFQRYAGQWRLGTLIFMLVLLPVKFLPSKKYTRYLPQLILIGVFAAAIYLNVRYLNLIDVDYWYKVN